ncbi:MAG: ClpXP protease specificity-enhancing factor [Proteobacteria bacterium]|nr:MAG: ClpXP protease specificity-enhancing factor [Pseudomonadota bacterium]
MTPKRPYLLRAFYDWIVDNNMTPHILVNADAVDVSVPRQHVKDGRIVLNIAPGAVYDFIMDNDAVSFSARFAGVAFYIYCPVYAIMAIYSRETQDGASFPADEYAHLQPASSNQEASSENTGGIALATVKTEATADNADTENQADDNDKPPPRSRPSLRVIK